MKLFYPTIKKSLVIFTILLGVLFFFTACPPAPPPPATQPPTAPPTPIPNTGDSYEPDDTYAQANVINEGYSQDHTLHTSSDYDYMMFSATNGTEYVAETFSPVDDVDTVLTLYNTNGTTQLEENDDYSGLQSRITWTCPASGTYYLRVNGWYGDMGAYSILLLESGSTAIPTETPSPAPTDGPTPTPGAMADWTIMVYLDADNNLEQPGLDDVNEMEGVDLSSENINVIVLLDRTPNYSTANGDWTDTRLYEIAYDSGGVSNSAFVSTELASAGLGLTTGGIEELNMGDPDVCIDFIDFCQAQYPATNYFLVFWNHGSGWKDNSGGGGKLTIPDDFTAQPVSSNRGVCWDDTDGGDCLYTAEIGTAVAGQGITVVGFDACLQQMIEVAYEIRNDASYMIGSEETEPGDGWEYNYWLSNLASSGQTPTDLVNAVVDAYETRYSSTSGTTLSGIDLSDVDALMTALNNFSTTLSGAITNSTIQSNVANTILNTESFYDTYNGLGDLNVDIWQMADDIYTDYDYADTQASALKTAVDNAVVAEWHHSSGNPNAHGLAIHYIYIEDFNPVGHDYAYMNGYSWSYPLAFVSNTTWNMTYSGGVTSPGLLYELWYHNFAK